MPSTWRGWSLERVQIRWIFVLGMVARPGRQFDVAQLFQLAARGRLIERACKFLMQLLDQIDQPPGNNAINRRDRTTLYHLDKHPTLGTIELRSFPRCLAVEQAVGTAGIETHHPVTHDLQTHTADPRRRAAAAAVANLGQCQ